MEDSEDSEEAEVVVAVAVAAAAQEDLLGAHQVVRQAAPHLEALLLPAARVRQVVSGPGVPLHLVVDPAVRQ